VNTKLPESLHDVHPGAERLIETARWHTVRYDNLRASTANRASFVVSANAILIAGVSFLFSWIAARKIYGGSVSLILVSVGMLLALVFALRSVRAASQVLVSKKTWRTLFKGDPPASLFYHHNDTLKEASTYAQFSSRFKEQTLDSELEWAVINLWIVLNMHAHRYRFLRAATNHLQVATLAFIGSTIAGVALYLIRY
jgi:hypothetical protein